MSDTDWEVNKTTSSAVTTYLYQQEKERKTKKVYDHGRYIKKTYYELDWDSESDTEQTSTTALYGGRQLYSGLLQQGLFILNKDTTATGTDVQVVVSDVGSGTAAKVFLQANKGAIIGTIAVIAVLCICCCVGGCLCHRHHKGRSHSDEHIEIAHHPAQVHYDPHHQPQPHYQAMH